MADSAARATSRSAGSTAQAYVKPQKWTPVDLGKFTELDLAAYDDFEAELADQHFRHVGDFEIEASKARDSAMAPTFARVMLSREANITATCYQIKPRMPQQVLTLLEGLFQRRFAEALHGFMQGIKPRQCMVFDTEFNDGCFLTTSNTESAGEFSNPPEIDALFFPWDMPLREVLDHHYARLVGALKAGTKPLVFAGLDDIRQSVSRARAITRAFEEAPGPEKAATQSAGAPAAGATDASRPTGLRQRIADLGRKSPRPVPQMPVPEGSVAFGQDRQSGELVAGIELPAWAGYACANSKAATAGSHVLLRLRGVNDAQLDQPQPVHHGAVRWLRSHDRGLHDTILAALASYAPRLQARLEEYGDEKSLRLLRAPDGWKQLIDLGYIDIFPYTRNGMPYLVFEFECNWDREHGFKMLVNGPRVVDIDGVYYGSKDILADGGTPA